MAVIYLVVYTKGLRRLGGLAIGGMVGLDIFLLAFISDASMNPARSLAPAWSWFSSILGNLWLYWTATFIGSSTVAFTVRRKIKNAVGK
jgi:aquaporin Z